MLLGAGELDGARRGFLLHAMQAFTPDGTPLGTAWAEVVNRAEGVSHAPAAQKQWEGADSIDWTHLPTPAPYHTFETPPVIK